MAIGNNRKLRHESTKLLRMLEYLDFSVIKAGCRSGYSSSEANKSRNHILEYSPWILATKHDVEYLFEYVNEQWDLIQLQNLLLFHLDNTREDWKKSLVLVTKYGHGNQVRRTARELGLPCDNIWEI